MGSIRHVIRPLSISLLIAALLTGLSADASAECVRLETRDAKKQATAVFEGTVKAVEKGSFDHEFAATIEVRRVWKGDVPPAVTVYYVESIDLRFEVGGTHILFTQPLTAKLRADYSLPAGSEPREMWVPTCVGEARADPGIVKELGQALPPRNADKEGGDMSGLVSDIRAAVAAQMTTLSFVRGRASGSSPGAARGQLSMIWADDSRRLHLLCEQFSSPVEAIRNLRGLRLIISAGVPNPLPGIADEAYYLGASGWNTYFARNSFVCQVTGPRETQTRTLTNIVVQKIDAALEEKRR